MESSMRMASIRGSMRSVSRSASSWRAKSTVFGRSGREEDDEEALRWAALEKLPTYDRMRRGILTGATGPSQEVDIHELGIQERKNLLEKLVRTAEEDNEKFLLKLRDRMERVGIDNPTIEVRFDHLNIDAEAYVGNRGVPTFLNFFLNKIMGALSALHIVPSGKRPISILHDISGIVRPCRMSLLLGPPGSGKTTLLLALSGKLDSTLKNAEPSGSIDHRINFAMLILRMLCLTYRFRYSKLHWREFNQHVRGFWYSRLHWRKFSHLSFKCTFEKLSKCEYVVVQKS